MLMGSAGKCWNHVTRQNLCQFQAIFLYIVGCFYIDVFFEQSLFAPGIAGSAS